MFGQAEGAELLARVRKWVDMKILHVTKMFCPMRLCLLPPVLHVHENNGTMIAWEGSEEEATKVYALCTYCNMHNVHKEVDGYEEDGHNRAMPRVDGWLVLFTETSGPILVLVAFSTASALSSSAFTSSHRLLWNRLDMDTARTSIEHVLTEANST